MAAKVFISYRRDDARYQARDIHRAFCKAIPSDDVFMDVDSIPPGANFRKILKGWVGECDVLLALIGPGWIDASDPKTKRRHLDNPSDFVRIEIGEALTRGIPVVPVLLDGTAMPDVDSLPGDLKELIDRQADFVDYRTFEADVERLIRKLVAGAQGGDKISTGIADPSSRWNAKLLKRGRSTVLIQLWRNDEYHRLEVGYAASFGWSLRVCLDGHKIGKAGSGSNQIDFCVVEPENMFQLKFYHSVAWSDSISNIELWANNRIILSAP